MSGAVRELPPLPAGIRTLTDEEADRLRGQFTSAKDLPSTPEQCITCKGTGVFSWYDGGEVGDWKCSCIDQWILHRYFLHCGIGLAYQRLSWADIMPEHPAIGAITEYADNSEWYMDAGIGMVLHGPNGTGKTMFATLLLKDLLGRGYDGYFTTYQDMAEAFMAGFKDNREKLWFVRRVRNAGMLVIDEVGRESDKSRPLVIETLENVVRHRVAYSRPTIITTNYEPEQIRNYGASLVSLLAERSTYLECRGEDFRRSNLDDRVLFERNHNLKRPVTVG